jgi:hypothetical protein
MIAEGGFGGTLPQDTLTDIPDWSVDFSGGTHITLGEDNKTFHLASGIYRVVALVVLSGASDGTGVLAGLGGLGGAEQGYGGLLLSPVPQQSAHSARVEYGLLYVASETSFTVQAAPTGGTTDDAAGFCGVDIVRLGDVA